VRRPIRADRLGDEADVAAGHPAPTAYTNGPRDFERLCEKEELDLVFTATPWEWHVPVMLAAMKNGKHAATEVPAAMTSRMLGHRRSGREVPQALRDDGELQLRPHGDDGFNMVRQGVFGEILHAKAGTCTTCAASSSRIGTKGCGVARGRRS
jgi:hypothetical protein